MPGLNVRLEIDASELQQELDRLRGKLTPEEIDKISVRIFRRTGQHVRGVLRRDLPREYEVKAGEVGKSVGNAKVTGGGGTAGAGCIIPVRGPRRGIGGSFRASGGAHGWQSLRRKYPVRRASCGDSRASCRRTRRATAECLLSGTWDQA